MNRTEPEKTPEQIIQMAVDVAECLRTSTLYAGEFPISRYEDDLIRIDLGTESQSVQVSIKTEGTPTWVFGASYEPSLNTVCHRPGDWTAYLGMVAQRARESVGYQQILSRSKAHRRNRKNFTPIEDGETFAPALRSWAHCRRGDTPLSAESQYDPQQPLYPMINADRLLDDVLWGLAVTDHSPYFPDEAEMDRLAPSLKELIARRINQPPDPPVCRHMEHHLSDLAYDVIHSLPAEQREGLTQGMREGTAGEAPAQREQRG